MATYIPAKKNTQYIFYAGLVSRSTGQFQSNPTIAAGDFKVSIDGGALANLGTLPAVTPASSVMVKFTIANTEMNGDNITIVGIDAAGAEWDDILISIPTSANQIDDLATPTNITAGTITTVTNLTNNNDKTGYSLTATTGLGNQTANITGNLSGSVGSVTAGVTVTTNNDKTGYALSSAGVQAIWDALTSALTTVGSIGKLIVTNLDAAITSRLAPTTAGRTLDVTATGEAGIDWNNIGSPSANVTLSATTIGDATTVSTTLSGISGRIPAALTSSGLMKSDTLRVGGTLQTAGDIPARLPAALSGDGFIKADMKSIDDELTTGNNATLNLKQLNIVNNAGDALIAQSTGGDGSGAQFLGTGSGNGIVAGGEVPLGTGAGVYIYGGFASGNGISVNAVNNDAVALNGGSSYAGLFALGGTYGIEAEGGTVGINAFGDAGDAIHAESLGGNGHGINSIGIGTGKSINAPQGIIGSDSEDLSVTNITDKVWDEAIAGHLTGGTTGAALNGAGSAGDPWGTPIPGAYGAGTAGKILGDNINATISSRSSHSVADIWAAVMETGYTAKESIRLMLSALAGKLSGAATTTVVIRDVNDAKDRITATVDADGNRTAVSHDVSD